MSFLKRYCKNPILKPRGSGWEKEMVYNAAAVYAGGKIHLVYRAQKKDKMPSSLGYASTKDGFNIDERLSRPVFVPRKDNRFERWGVEDPRTVILGNRIYMTYTAFGQVSGMSNLLRKVGHNCIQIGMTSISLKDFLAQKWNWAERSYPLYRMRNKDGFLLPEKVNGRYFIYHRIEPNMWCAESKDLKTWFNHRIVMEPCFKWEYYKIGGGAPPIKTRNGWVHIYHGVDSRWRYSLGLAVADLKDPSKIIYRHKTPVLAPEMCYERKGIIPYVTYSNGVVEVNGEVFVYYGGADTVLCVATTTVKDILKLF
ncbi:MAG: glycosidase [Candidatus Aureabacteria bacterium]|nr:glycosidase [Candidatus Auribacterota bacterium]